MANNDTFRALVVEKGEHELVASLQQLTVADLPDEDVLVQVDYSTLNYKEGLGFANRNKIFRIFPIVPGVDLAGTVVASQSPAFKPGDKVILNGWSVGERYWGGYAQMARIKSDFLIHLPPGMDTKKAMSIGTAGYTAMLMVMTLEEAGVTPGSGPILVTGATGGVGGNAVAILNKLGYEVTALTRSQQPSIHEYLHKIGAREVICGEEWTRPPAPLESQKWAGAIDNIGSIVLARILAEMKYGGCVAACGLAAGFDLPTTVMPFILRGVSLRGVDSVSCPTPRRKAAWARLVTDITDEDLAAINTVIPLAEVPRYAKELLAGNITGHVVVDVNA
ncbi:oxidoreductase [Desulfoprunum benzoelyticum]|uniref:Acrylyl-CoA reductase (NADPH) n=1 Tax=Desulfoprunum benzoelyticum TaxID=1506996 RepID=A0A840UWD2_9BACT|nr:MDR family oxidoreductase [Desulfoprunum benzoelyticum]MBB5349203.1 acrylyl-CoA reductase (NADPH) [Desulfoprunum benzoelyticum]MBM9530865.1 oxidoreductase [Desulfoprunum benzoelyticum]